MRDLDGNLGKHSRALWRAWIWLGRYARPLLATYVVCLVMGTHWPNLEIIPPPEQPHPLHSILKLDKVWHVIGFGGLMVLLILAEVGGRGRPWTWRCVSALVVGVVFSITDELTQGLMPGREVSASDLVTNLLVVLGVYLLALLPAEREPTPVPNGIRLAVWLSLPVLGLLMLWPNVTQATIHWLWNQGVRLSHLHMLDEIAHGVVSSGLSVAVFVMWPMASRRPRRSAAMAIGLLALSGPGVEVAQHFSGRGAQWQDVLAHAIGLLLAMMWWAARLSWSPRLREPATPPSPAAAPGMSPPA